MGFTLAFLIASTAGADTPEVASTASEESGHAHEHAHDSHEEVEEIVVTASPLEHGRDELVAPVTRLDRDEILDQTGHTLGEVLKSQVGMNSSNFSAGASRPVVRGQDAFRVRVLEDGIGIEGVSELSPDHGVPANPLVSQRLEVVRGSATLRYGGGAIGGVVNSITNRVPKQRVDSSVEGGVFAGYGFNASSRDIAAVLDGNAGPVSWHFDAASQDSDDYAIPGTPDEQLNTFVDATSFAGGASYVGQRGRIGLGAIRFDSEYGIPAPEDPLEPVRIDMRQNRYTLEGDWYAGLGLLRELRLRTAYSDYRHDEIPLGQPAAATFHSDESEGRVEALHDPLVGLVGALGLQWRVLDTRAGGEASELLAPAETRQIGGYLFEELELGENVLVDVGLRVEGAWLRGTPASGAPTERSFVPLSGSAGITWSAIEEAAMGFSLSVSQRAPSAIELFAKGPHEASGTFEIGDPGLDEESSVHADLTVDGILLERVDYELSGFYTRYYDYIFGALTGRSCDESGACVPGDSQEFDELRFVPADSEFYGVELALAADLLDWLAGTWGVDAQFDWVRGQLASGGNIPRMPPIRWGAGLYYRSERLWGRFEFLRYEEQDEVSAFETPTPGYTMLNLRVRYVLALLDDRLPVDLSLVAENLLDQKARNSVAFNKDEVLLPGRNIRLSVGARF